MVGTRAKHRARRQLCHLSSHHPQSFLISVPISAPPARPGASPGRERPRCSPEQQSPVGLAVDTLLSWGATLLLSWVPTSHTPCLGTPSTCSHPGYPLYMLSCLGIHGRHALPPRYPWYACSPAWYLLPAPTQGCSGFNKGNATGLCYTDPAAEAEKQTPSPLHAQVSAPSRRFAPHEVPSPC